MLFQLAVQPCLQGKPGPRIHLIRHQRSHRAKRVEALGAPPLSVGLLKIARGDVVHDGVAANVRPYVFVRTDFSRAFADHDGQLAFEIHALRLRRNADRLARRDHRRRRLEKNQRLLRDLVAQLRCMFAIIAADADDLARYDGREELGGEKRHRLEGPGCETGPGIFFEGWQQSLNPERARAIDNFAVLWAGWRLKTAIFHCGISSSTSPDFALSLPS